MLVSIIFVERIRCMDIASNCAKLPLLKFKFINSKFPDINVLAFQISDFEYTQQITAQNT